MRAQLVVGLIAVAIGFGAVGFGVLSLWPLVSLRPRRRGVVVAADRKAPGPPS